MEPDWRQEELELRQLFGRVRRNILSVSLCMGLGVIAGFMYLVLAEPRYTAKAALMLETETGAFGNVDTLFLDLDTHANLMRSDTIVAEVVRRLGLEDIPGFKSDSGKLERALNYTRERLAQPLLGDVRHLDDILQEAQEREATETEPYRILSSVPKVRKSVGVLRLGKTRLLELSFTSNDPQLSAEVANTFAKVYLDHLKTIRQSAQLDPENPMAVSYNVADQGAAGAAGLFDDLSVVSWASVPTTHSTPNIKVVLAAFGLIGLFAGVALAVRKEWALQT